EVGDLARADIDAGVLARADLVLLADVLEHVDDDAGALRWLLDALSPGAHALITVPAGPELWSAHDVALGHRRRYTPESFSALWQGARVTSRLLSPFNARLYLPIRLRRRWSRPTDRTGPDLAAVDVRTLPAPLNRLLLRAFAGEARRLAAAVDGAAPYRRGVSLIALLRR